MNDAFQITFGLLGGLAIFIFGMNMMSESLQKAAGEKMKKILGILTVNPVMGVLAGTIATAVMQSSSATTVMVIGFVSAGLMTLKQGISVILGANIGTTMTAQLLAFNISDYIFVIIFVGFIVSFVFKSEKIKSIGQTIFAFGLLFEGIQIMSSVMKPLAESPVFINMIDHVSGIPVLGVLVGTLMTLVVQSSSATIAVLQNFAAQAGPDGVSSIIGLEGAIPVLLGDNIGTTITALLACIGQSRDAKRTALAHCTFNITGAFLFIWFVKPYAHFIQAISTKGPEVEVIARQIANAHTIFNITMTLIWLPLIWLLVKIVVKILPYKEKNSKQKDVPIFLDPRLISQPAAAMEMVAREILRCSGMVEQMIHRLNHAIERQDLRRVDSILRQAVVVRKLYDNIVSYLSSLFSSGSMTEEQATQTAGMMYILSDIERADALCTEATESLQSILEKKHKLSPEAVEDLCRGLQIIEDMYRNVLEVIRTGNGEDARKIVHKKDNVLDLTLKLRKNHMKRVKQGACDSEMTSDFTRILHSFDRIGNSCANIADAALTGVSFESVLK
ncbi:Na/Pi cotransporter family protein [Clostridiales Family XIII bacterium BX16]|uniref:Na/Pi cotransporter family protein n=1 Tax=Lentihominibacter faecis TaxID=2764712 RepID=A0A923NCN9_9FIRM|nr:Na/Pi cotransporter family protein [Lentihominibacter faecis]MBC5999277.1 Na/Pi cotransporter family protein [Lentihominibacter faecis]